MKAGSFPASFLRFAVLSFSTAALHAAEPALVWSDEFNQPDHAAPDSAKWTYERGATGWGNHELENYTDSRDNSYIVSDSGALDGKALVIVAARTASGGYTSARLKTQGRFAAHYGRIESRLKSAEGKGIWPAFWMLGENITTVDWPDCGEIDIMEMVGAHPTKNYGTMHGPGYSGAKAIGATYTLPGGATYDSGYHVFAIDWTPDKFVWSVDGVVYHTATPASLPAGTRWVFDDSPFFLLLDIAVGGDFPGGPDATTSFPQTLTVDYVRVYARPPAAPSVASAFASGAGEVTLTWQPVANPEAVATSGYRLERATDAAFSQNLVSFQLGAATSYVDTTAAPNTAYFYRVATIASSGVSDTTPTLSVRTLAANPTGAARFANLAARSFCGTGNDVAIGGLVIDGAAAKRVLLRAVGPTLASAGLGADEILRDPILTLYHGANVIATNDDWETNANSAAIVTTSARVGATPLDAADHASAALLLTLPPGVYSFVVTGKNATTGIVLIESYDAD